MDFTDYILLREGWNEKLVYEQAISRKMTMIIASSMVGGKNVKPEKLWPLPGDKKGLKMVKYGGVEMTERMAMKLERNKKKRNG
jgi:hypothetical protein